MDGSKLVSFLGYSSIYPELDDFLLASGVKKRPKKVEDLQWVKDSQLGISLTFQLSETFDEDSAIGRKSDGKFILRTVQFLRGFSGILPFGFSWDLKPQDLQGLFGKPIDEDGPMFFFKNRRIGFHYQRGAASIYTVDLPDHSSVSRYGVTVLPE